MFTPGSTKKLFWIISFLLTSAPLFSQSFKVYGVSDLVRVFEDGYKLPSLKDTVKIFGLRGEVISGQLAISAKKDLADVNVSVGELSKKDGKGVLPASMVEWNFVGSIPVERNTPNQPASVLVRQAPAKFPEYLMTERKADIKKKMWQSVWLTVNIPAGAEAGTYTGNVTVRSGEEAQSLPVSITVYPFTLPEKRHLKVVESMSTGGFERFHGIKEMYSPQWFDMLRLYAANMVAHRQNVFQVPMESVVITKSKNGELKFDYTNFDRTAQVFWSTGKMDYLETGGIGQFRDDKWASTDISPRNYDVKDETTGKNISLKGTEVLPSLLASLESHLRQKGWLSRTLFGIHDEPSVHNAKAWMELSAYMHKYAPDIRRLDAIETTFLLDQIDVAVPKLDHFAAWNDIYRDWHNKGNELWFYTVGIYQGSLLPNKTIDVPLIDCRLIHWLNYKYDASGYLHWGWNQWNEDPFKEVGMHVGDAWHVYPSRDGVLNSLRWEEMRNGIQDYEYFRMLEDRIRSLKDSLGADFSWIDPSKRAKEIAGNVVKTFADRSEDPEVLYKTKLTIIDELLRFNKSPRLYIQTNPAEGTTITNHSSVEILGWTEPGTKIVINGKEVPVGYNGLFMEQCGGEFIDTSKVRLGDNVTVRATGPQGNRTVVRNFNIRY